MDNQTLYFIRKRQNTELESLRLHEQSLQENCREMRKQLAQHRQKQWYQRSYSTSTTSSNAINGTKPSSYANTKISSCIYPKSSNIESRDFQNISVYSAPGSMPDCTSYDATPPAVKKRKSFVFKRKTPTAACSPVAFLPLQTFESPEKDSQVHLAYLSIWFNYLS